MKKILALVLAFVLFVATVYGSHILASDNLNFNNPEFGTWVSSKKFQSHEAISKNLSENSIVVFGSSEFAHGRKTPYHPKNLFKGQALDMMLIGEGYYQCLSHATALAAIGSEIENKKVVLVLSPQWFRRSGVLPEAYASRFSEDNFIAMLKNSSVPYETKKHIIKRTERLLQGDKPALKRVHLYERVLWIKNAGFKDKALFRLQYGFLQERSRLGVLSMAYARGLQRSKVEKTEKPVSIDWDAYLKRAERDGKKATASNPYFVKDGYFFRKLKPEIAAKRDFDRGGSYLQSPEYGDLKCFLEICKAENIKPLLVSVPVNGWWYDYVGFSQENRRQYYENIRGIAEDYGASLADFSGDEYTKYFLEDTIHLGWKGWVLVNESIYNFAKETL